MHTLTSSSLIQAMAVVIFWRRSLIGRLFPSPMVIGGGLALVCRPIVPFSLTTVVDVVVVAVGALPFLVDQLDS